MTASHEPAHGVPGNRWDLLDGVEPAARPSLSVIVVHYEQPDQLARTLLALKRQDYPRALVEIIVVDDGSAEAPVVPEGVVLLRQRDEGFRLAAARNLGAGEASNDVLVFLDADTSPEPGYLQAISRLPALIWDGVTVGRRRHADFAGTPDAAPVEIIGPERALREPTWLIDAYRSTADLLLANHRSYRYVIGAVIACSRRFFTDTGGFDESFTEYGGEDWEWAYRAWLNGGVLAHAPDAVAWHDGPDSSGRGTVDLTDKNAEALRLADLIPVPDSRGHAGSPERADIAVVGPPIAATPGQAFVSLDSVLAALPGATAAPVAGLASGRFDRVRVDLILEQAVRVLPGGLAEAIAAIDSDRYAEVVLRDSDGAPLVRLVSRREQIRQARWPSADRLPTLGLPAGGIEPLVAEIDLEAYLGGW